MGQRVLAELAMLAGAGVSSHLRRRLGAGDHRRDGRALAAKAERQACKSLAFGENGLNLVHGGKARFDVDAREGLTDVECLSVAVVAAVVIGRKDRIGRYLPGEQA